MVDLERERSAQVRRSEPWINSAMDFIDELGVVKTAESQEVLAIHETAFVLNDTR